MYLYFYIKIGFRSCFKSQFSSSASGPDRLVTMLFDDSFRMVTFFGFLLDRYLQSNPMKLHWSIQPGVSDGCLEWFSTIDAAKQHYDTVGMSWQGAPGPATTLVQLEIRADRVSSKCMIGKMVLKDGKLKVFEELVAGNDGYRLTVLPNHSMPALLAIDGSAPLRSDHQLGGDAGVSGLVLYCGFLKKYLQTPGWGVDGLHWSMQPGSVGRITLSTDPKGYPQKYKYYQDRFTGQGPEIEYLVLTMSEQAANKILTSGALWSGDVSWVHFTCT